MFGVKRSVLKTPFENTVYQTFMIHISQLSSRTTRFKLLVLAFFSGFLFNQEVNAQIDQEFWFAPPEITCGTASECNGTRRDNPIFVVVSTLNEPATVQLWKPADLSFTPLVYTLAANSTQQIPINRELFETKPADSVLTTGILIRATAPISAYYEIRSPNNTDIFVLKGKNANGTNFYLPFQNDYINQDFLGGAQYDPLPKSGFVIIATDDSTTVTITPTRPVAGGHPANVPYTVYLHRGQTYYGEAIDQDPANRLIGTHITSDKPIAVTIKDDMIDLNEFTDGGADVAGDQIMPVEWTGTRYVVIKGNLQNTPTNQSGDKAYILAIEDNTSIFIDGNSTPAAVINRGEQFKIDMENSAYQINTDKNVYVWQISGIGDQLAGAIIPSLDCTGSNQVGFIRSSSNTFIMNLIIKGGSGAENQFVLNGNPNLITGSMFQPVAGSPYLFAQITFSTNAIAAGTTSLLQNFGTELFHMGIINRGNSQTCNFGYFTNFSYLNLGTDRDQCLGDSAVLDAGPGKTSYLWNTGDVTQKITVTEPGTYWVQVESGSDCIATDTITVSYYAPPIDIGPRYDTICEGSTLLLNSQGVYLFEWQDGSTASSFLVTEPGDYFVKVTDFQGCVNRDTISIANSPKPPTPVVSGGGSFCAGTPVNLSMSTGQLGQASWIGPGFTFFTGLNISPPSVPSSSGQYVGFYAVGSCQSDGDTLTLEINPAPEAYLGLNDTICGVTTVTLNPGLSQPDYQYLWQDNSTGSTLTINASGSYSVTITNSFNCTASDTISLLFSPLPSPVVFTGATEICEGENFSFGFVPETGVVYEWSGPNGFTTTGSTVNIINASSVNTGEYSVQSNLNGCTIAPQSITVSVFPNPSVSINDTTACGGGTVVVDAKSGFTTYSWSNDASTQTTSLSAGTHFVTVTNQFGCAATDTFTISNGGLTAQFAVNPSAASVVGGQVNFTDQSTANASPLASWSWIFGNGQSSTIQNPQIVFNDPGTFSIQLTVTDEVGCSDTASLSYLVTSDISIPNSFTPNGDGFNDFFVIKGLEAFPNSQINIYNRWGNQIFASSDYQNNWGAENHGDGVYFFVLKLSNGETLKGDITVIRKK